MVNKMTIGYYSNLVKKKIPNIFDLIFEYLSYRYTELFFLGD